MTLKENMRNMFLKNVPIRRLNMKILKQFLISCFVISLCTGCAVKPNEDTNQTQSQTQTTPSGNHHPGNHHPEDHHNDHH